MEIITASDLALHPDITGEVDLVRASALISTVVARAARFAPCLLSPDFSAVDAARGVLLDVVARRYNSIVPGISRSHAEGPFSESYDTRGVPAVTFWPSEVAELQAMCSAQPDALQRVPLSSFPDPEPWPDPSVARPVWSYLR